MEYRGIQLHESVKLYNKDGSYNKQIKMGLDKLADKLDKTGHILLSEFKGNGEKVLIDFKCVHKPHRIAVSQYKNDRGCPRCSGKCPIQAKEKFIELLNFNGHVWVQGVYKSAKTKVLIDFLCGHEPYWITPDRYKQGDRCPKCSRHDSDYVKEEYLKLIKSNGHEIKSEWKGANSKIKIDFKCGHKPSWINPNNYKRGHGCRKCSNNCPIQAKEDFMSLIEIEGHKLLSPYKNNREKVLIDFMCNHKPNWISPCNYKKGVRCPRCNQSKGEQIICDWLDERMIEYEIEKRLLEKKWRYDIIISSQNLIVEVHGAEHYEESHLLKKRKITLQQQQEIDYKKKSYAESLGYYYIEVDYREHKPKLALERFLQLYHQRQKKNAL